MRPIKYPSESVLGCLPKDGLTTYAWQMVANQQLGISRATFMTKLEELIAAKKVLRVDGPENKHASHIKTVLNMPA